MAYTPELDKSHSALLRRLAWRRGEPMTITLKAIIENEAKRSNKKNICERCEDDSYCNECMVKAKRKHQKSKTFGHLVELLPIKHRVKTILDAIKNAYDKYGYDHVARDIESVNTYFGNYRALLLKTLKESKKDRY